MFIRTTIFINSIFAAGESEQTLKQKFISTEGEIKELELLKYDDGNVVSGMISCIPYSTRLNNVEISCADNLEEKVISYTHFGSKSIISMDDCSKAIIGLQEFVDFIKESTDSSKLAELKKKLSNKLYEDNQFYFPRKEVDLIAEKINALDRSSIVKSVESGDKTEITVDTKMAQTEIIKILNDFSIHLNLDTCAAVSESQGELSKVFYLSFEDKNDEKKKYKTPIYKMTIKDGHITDISEEFRGKTSSFISMTILGIVVSLIIVAILGMYIYKRVLAKSDDTSALKEMP